MRTLEELKVEIEAMRHPSDHMMLKEVNKRNQALVTDLADIMVQQIEGRQLEEIRLSSLFDAIIAIEKKLGVDNSDDPNSMDYKVNQLEGDVFCLTERT